MTDNSSLSENTPSSSSLETDTYRVVAVNAADGAVVTDATDDDRESGDHRTPRPFDFHLDSAMETPTATATVLELFASYLAAASHALGEVDERVDIERITVEGAVSAGVETEPTYGSPVDSVDATVHVETSVDADALDHWRRRLRDAEATQAAIPTDTTVSLTVTRVSR